MLRDPEPSRIETEREHHGPGASLDGTSVGGALPLRGSLVDHPFPTLLHALRGARATGTLLLASGQKRKAVQLRDGYPVAVKSNLISECLGNYLVRRGLLSQSDFDQSVERVKSGDGRHGEILIMMDLLSEGMVGRALVEQAEEKLLEIFSWTGGGFKFKIGSRISRGNELALTRSPANVIVEGARRRVAIGLVDNFILANGDRYVVPSGNPFYRFQEIDLGTKEAEFLLLVDGSRKLEHFRTAGPALRRVLYGLIATQILDLRDRPKAPEAAGEARCSLSTSENPTHDRSLRNELAAMVKCLREENYFEMLGVSQDARGDAIDAAFSERARRVHPDRYQIASGAVRQLAEEAFEILSRASATLQDTKLRTGYVRELRKGERVAAEQAENERVIAAEIEFQKGEAKLHSRDREGALRYFGQALQLNSAEGEYHAHYGWCLFLCHPDNEVMIEEAIEHVARGAKLAPDREKPYLFLGRLYKATGRIRPAEKMFARAVQIQPDCVDALRELRLIGTRRKEGRSLWSRFFPSCE